MRERKKKSPVCGGACKDRTFKAHYNFQRRRKQGHSFAEINAQALAVLPALLARWLPDGKRQGAEYIARNPRRADRSPGSFKVNIRTGRWADFATGDKGGDVISLAAYLSGKGQGEAARDLAEMLGARS